MLYKVKSNPTSEIFETVEEKANNINKQYKYIE